ncbi:MAG: hypothetical protein PUG15_01185 [Bacteroidales bacterium]|nr:hypothetical protein [Bacteroidales bacterium]
MGKEEKRFNVSVSEQTQMAVEMMQLKEKLYRDFLTMSDMLYMGNECKEEYEELFLKLDAKIRDLITDCVTDTLGDAENLLSEEVFI